MRKRCPLRYWKPPGYQTYMTKIELLYSILLLKQLPQLIRKEY
jgi:hypothetical protein